MVKYSAETHESSKKTASQNIQQVVDYLFRRLELPQTQFGVTQGRRKWYHSIDRLWLPIGVYGNHGLIWCRFRDKRWFQSKLQIFTHPMYFAPRWRGFPLELGIGAGVKN